MAMLANSAPWRLLGSGRGAQEEMKASMPPKAGAATGTPWIREMLTGRVAAVRTLLMQQLHNWVALRAGERN